jgi:DUF4097 and DUF4098 domain-containing protein YvlB
MMKKIIIIISIFFLNGLLFGQDHLLFSKKLSEYEPGKKLILEVNETASINVYGDEKIKETLQIFGFQKDAGIFEEKDGKLKIRNLKNTDDRLQNQPPYFKILLPNNFNFEFNCQGGLVIIKNITGTIIGRMLSGDVSLRGLNGTVDVVTNGGHISVSEANLNGLVHTLGGDISLSRVIGDLQATTEGGKLLYYDVYKKKYDGLVKLVSMGGDIEIDEAPYGAKVRSEGGNITIKSSDIEIWTNTKGGNIILQNTKGDIGARTGSGNINVEILSMNGEKRKCELVSNSGDIHLTIPKSFDPTIFVRLAYTKNSSRNFKIQSDFDLNITETKDWDLTEGPPRKFIIGERKKEGSDNYLIDIKTVNGEVFLKRK